MTGSTVQEAELSGRGLHEIRKEQGLTQEGLAESAELSGNYISDMELRRKVPSLTIIVRLSDVLDMAVADLLIDFTRDAVKKMRIREHRNSKPCKGEEHP